MVDKADLDEFEKEVNKEVNKRMMYSHKYKIYDVAEALKHKGFIAPVQSQMNREDGQVVLIFTMSVYEPGEDSCSSTPIATITQIINGNALGRTMPLDNDDIILQFGYKDEEDNETATNITDKEEAQWMITILKIVRSFLAKPY